MRRYPDPESRIDQEELEELKPQQWMLDALKLNPNYASWGPNEDYMAEGGGWSSNLVYPTWDSFKSEFKGFDDLNECVHFYFSVERDSAECVTCDRSGYNAATKQISDDFYDFRGTGRRWKDNITQDEVDALVEAGRIREFDNEKKEWVSVSRTAAEVNASNSSVFAGPFTQHDAINQGILVRERAKSWGVYGYCTYCLGKGYIYTEEHSHLALTLWIIHPRKGASRTVVIEELNKSETYDACLLLKEAAERNAERFSKVCATLGEAT